MASILGRKYGVKVETGGTDAYTDGTVIRLPSLPSEIPGTVLITRVELARQVLAEEIASLDDLNSIPCPMIKGVIEPGLDKFPPKPASRAPMNPAELS